MAKSRQRGYGVGGPSLQFQPAPIEAQRAPASTDTDFTEGQIWLDQSVTPTVSYEYRGGGTWSTSSVVQATETTAGIAEIATAAEATAGVNDTTIMTPAKVALVAIAGAPTWSEVTAGIVEKATQAEAETGTDNDRGVTPLRVFQALASGNAPISVTTITGSGAVDINTTGAISLDADVASNFSVAGAGIDLSLESSGGRVVVNGEEAAADAVRILSAAGGLDVDVALLASISSSRNNAQAILLEASAGGIDILATGAATEDIDIVNTGGSVNISATESAADSITIVSTAGGIDILASGAAAGEDIDVVATGSSLNLRATEGAADAITIQATAGGVDLDGAGQVNIASSQNAADSIVITSSAGGIDILASGAAAGEDIDIVATGSSVNIESTEDAALAVYLHANGGTSETIRVRADQGTGVASVDILSDVGGVTITAGLNNADAINIVASNAAGGIDIDSGTAGFIVDTTGGISLDSAAASNFTATGAFDITVQSTAGSININAGEAAADAVNVDSTGGFDLDAALQVNIDSAEAAGTAVRVIASNAAGGIDVDAGTGGIAVDTTGALSLDSAAASNFTVTGAFDLTVSTTLGSLNLTAGEDAADAIVISAGAGGIDVLATGAAGQDIDVVNTGGSVNISATESAADSITIVSTAGGIDILASGAAAGEDIDIVATGSSVNISATESAADSITIISTAGGIDISASGAAAGEDIDITATGSSINITATENVTDAIVINASGAASALQLDAGTGSVRIGTGLVVAATAVNNAASPYTVLGTDYFIAVDSGAGAVTVTLPAATALAGRTFVIRDVGGAAAANNITIGGGGTNLVGGGASAATKVLSANYAGATVYSDGTIWAYAYVA
jgi:hypothetical protein